MPRSRPTAGGSTAPTTNLASDQASPFGVAVDSHHIYRANSGLVFNGGTIMRANLDGSDQEELVGGQFNTGDLTVDAHHIYWTDLGSFGIGVRGTISQSGLDGSDPHRLLIDGFLPSGVAVDSSHLYWADSFSGRIVKANLDGTERDLLFRFPHSPADGIAVEGDHIYWTTGGDPDAGIPGTIMEANVNSTGITTLVTGQDGPIRLAVAPE